MSLPSPDTENTNNHQHASPNISGLLGDGDASGTGTGQVISLADLFRELQETNRLLRAIAMQNAVEQPPPTEHPSPLAAVTSKLSSPRSGGDSHSPSTPKLGIPREHARQLVEALAGAVFDPGEIDHLKWFRDQTISLISRSTTSQTRRQGKGWNKVESRELVRLVVSLDDQQVGRRSELLWSWRTSSGARNQPLTDREITQLHCQWPVYFDLNRLTQGISRDSGWILGKNPRRDGVICASPLVYGPDQKVISAHAVLDPSQKHDPKATGMSDSNLDSPGSLWHFTTPVWTDGVLPLRNLALIAAACLMNPEYDMDTVHDFLHQFCAAWKPLSLRGRGHEFGGWTGNSDTSYQHTLRCFSNVRSTDRSDFVPYVRCHRESGQFPALPGTPLSSFVERRMSVLCRWSGADDARSFTIVVLGDFQNVRFEAHDSNDLLTDWEDRQFVVKGDNAGYHLLQSVVHRMLMFWEKEWAHCLDELDNTVNTKLDDILNDDTSNSLMFDSSFARSRVYFKTLEMLRIFGDIIRETGRDLQEMDPDRLLQGSFRRAGWDARYFLREDPVKDKALWENWRILSEFQAAAEDRLLRRIAEKTEEIKSLRDGLFNATSLREAARSTTMNRYVIVFTVVTVLYIPPSFTTSLFGTPLFEAEEQAETVERFKISTVVFCVITYVLSFLLIWVADKWDTAGSLYHQTRSLWASAWTGASGSSAADHRSSEKDLGFEDTDRRMSV